MPLTSCWRIARCTELFIRKTSLSVSMVVSVSSQLLRSPRESADCFFFSKRQKSRSCNRYRHSCSSQGVSSAVNFTRSEMGGRFFGDVMWHTACLGGRSSARPALLHVLSKVGYPGLWFWTDSKTRILLRKVSETRRSGYGI